MNEQTKQKEKYQRDLERSSRLEELKQLDSWTIVEELIDEEITSSVNQALSDECLSDHNKYIQHKAAIDALKALKSKFVTVGRLGKQAIDSLNRIENG